MCTHHTTSPPSTTLSSTSRENTWWEGWDDDRQWCCAMLQLTTNYLYSETIIPWSFRLLESILYFFYFLFFHRKAKRTVACIVSTHRSDMEMTESISKWTCFTVQIKNKTKQNKKRLRRWRAIINSIQLINLPRLARRVTIGIDLTGGQKQTEVHEHTQVTQTLSV